MKTRIQQVVPAMIMAGAAAVPVATTAAILTHMPGGASSIAAQPSVPVAMAPPRTASNAGGATAPAPGGGTKTYGGPVVSDPFGGVQASVTVVGNKIADVSISAPQANPTSAAINQQAVPLLRSETLRAQSAQINTVSGATYTSQAYAQSLQAALSQAQSHGNAVMSTGSASPAGRSGLSGTTQALSVSVTDD